jgi:hypothetical protein
MFPDGEETVMTPARLSQLTWTVDDRRAWNDAYREALRIARRRQDRARAGDVKEYDSYLRGEVYGYVVDPNGPDEDACWGFVGDIDYCKEAANESAECAAQARAERQRKRGRSLHRGGFVTAGGTS